MCNSSQECTDIDGIPRFCFEKPSFSDKEFFCSCTAWFGWVGDKCNEESFTLQYYRVSISIISLIILIGLLLCLRTLIIFLTYFKKSGKAIKKLTKPVAILQVLLILFFAIAIVEPLLVIPSLFDEKRFDLNTIFSLSAGDTTDVDSAFAIQGYKTAIISAVFLLMAQTQVILCWLEVVEKISGFFAKEVNCISVKTLTNLLKYGIPVVLVLNVGVVIFAFFYEHIVFIGIISVFIAFGFIYGYSKFIVQLKKLPKVDSSSESATSLITRTYTINLIGQICLALSTTVLYVLLAVYYDIVEPGTFNYLLVVKDIVSLSSLLIGYNLAWYSHQITLSVLQIEPRIPWFPLSFSSSV